MQYKWIKFCHKNVELENNIVKYMLIMYNFYKIIQKAIYGNYSNKNNYLKFIEKLELSGHL